MTAQREGVPKHRAIISMAAMAATTMQALDGTIANVALNHMQASLSATPDQIAWVLTSYIVASAIMIPLTGFLALRFGRKRVFLISIAGFTISSALCGLAVSLGEMVLFRSAQGLFGAALIPLSQALILDTYEDKDRGRALSLWGIGVMVGPVLGPTLGGYLTEYYNWRYIFLINVPFGVLSFVGLALFAEESTKDTVRRFAGYGFAMLALSVAAFQLMLDRGERADWFDSNEIIMWSAIAGVAAVLFVHHMLVAKNPFIDRRILADRNFVLGTVFYFLVASVMFVVVALVPVMLQGLLDYPVLTTGLVIAPRGVGMMLGMVAVGRLSSRIDPRHLMAVGVAITVWSLWELQTFNLYTTQFPYIWTGIVQGIGIGGCFVSLNLITYSTLDIKLRTEATAIANAVRSFGSSIGISIMFTLLVRRTEINHAHLVESVTPFNEVLQGRAMPEVWDLTTAAGRMAMDMELMRQARMMAFIADFQMLMVATLIMIPLLLFVRPMGVFGRS